MEWIVIFLGVFCIYLFSRCRELETKIDDVNKYREDWVDNNLRALYTQLYNHTHDTATGYVDRMSVMDRPKEEEPGGKV